MSLNVLGIIGIAVMLLLILSGVRIGLVMFMVGFTGYAMATNLKAALVMLKTYTFTSAMNYTLAVVPLFVLMGQFVFYAGISDDLFRSSRTIFGKQPGGLAYAGIFSSAAFGAICGTLGATTATMCSVAKPIMKEHKYSDKLIGGVLSCGGTLGTLIPPSTPAIMYGVIAELSIGKLFAATTIPGIIMAICFCGVVFVWTKINPLAAPGTEEGYSVLEKIKSIKGFIPLLLIFSIVIVGMFSGFFSITESAAAGVLVSFIFLAVRRRATKADIIASLKETALTVGSCMIIIIGANVFGCFLTITGLTATLANFVAGLNMSRTMIIAVIILIYAVMGCFIDCVAMIMITVPIFLPVIVELGYDPIWFGVIVVMVLNLGAVTPPVGAACFVASRVMKDIPLTTIYKGVVPFLLAFLIAFLIVVLFPQVALFLPSIAAG